VLDTTPAAANAANLDAFRQGLKELGYVEGRNVVIEYRSLSQTSQIPEMVRELVGSKIDVIVTRGTAATKAAQSASRTIPIVMAASGDPVGTGVASGLASPGGNVTGLTSLSAEVSVKRLEMLKDTIPGLKRVAMIIDLGMGLVTLWRTTEETARSMGLTAQLLDVRKVEELESAFDAAVKQRANALVTGAGPVLQTHASRIVELAARHRLPAMYPSREFVDAGGLMAYGPHFPDLYRRAAAYVDKILKGAKPAALPIQQPTKFELVINLKTAKTLGLTIPHAVLLRADEVIR
jgi:putative ABC transport system substrate-binding protein